MKDLKVFGAITAIIGVPVVLTTMVKFRKADCNISELHAHKYVNSDRIVRFLDSELCNVDGFRRSKDYILITEEDKELLKFEEKMGLVKIGDNIEYLLRQEKENQDTIEYRYKYYHSVSTPHYLGLTVLYTDENEERYTWTPKENVANATGESRVCHHMYKAYKIIKNKKGKYYLKSSGYVDSLDDVKDEYPYIGDNYHIIIDKETGKEITYEDGAPSQNDIEVTEKELNKKTKKK